MLSENLHSPTYGGQADATLHLSCSQLGMLPPNLSYLSVSACECSIPREKLSDTAAKPKSDSLWNALRKYSCPAVIAQGTTSTHPQHFVNTVHSTFGTDPDPDRPRSFSSPLLSRDRAISSAGKTTFSVGGGGGTRNSRRAAGNGLQRPKVHLALYGVRLRRL